MWRWGTVRVRPPAVTPRSCRPRLLAGAAWLVLAAAPALSPAATRAQTSSPAHGVAWSRPATLTSSCAPSTAPLVVFPSEGPSLRTGAGALVWASSGGGCSEAAQLAVSAIGQGERPGPPILRPLRGSLVGSLDAVGTSFGRVAVLAGLEASALAGPPVAQLLQGPARGLAPAFRAHSYGAVPALARAYLGDAAMATVRPEAIAVRVERHYEHDFERARLIPIGPGPVSALTITMDFRSDVLVVWEQGGSVYAHMLRQSGRPDPTQRLGPSAPRPLLQALVSDNDHGMVAWASTSGARARTQVFLDLSSAGVTFGPAQRLVSFPDPARLGARPGSLSLIRLSTENVLLAWTDLEAGHYVVRSAPAVFATDRPTRRLSDPAGQAVLDGFAPGAAGEAVAVWSGTAGASADPRASLPALWAARMAIVPHDRVLARKPSLLAEPGPGASAGVAVDPGSDRAVVAWVGKGTVQYATSSAPARYSQHAPVGSAPAPTAGSHWVRILAAAGGGAIVLLLGAILLWRRRAQRAGGALAGSRERRL